MAIKRDLTPAEEKALIERELGRRQFIKPVKYWLDTGSKPLNAVLGSPDYGLAYGKMIEIFGPNSHGKTMLSLLIAGLAQRQGATVAWVDFEQCLDQAWVEAQGVDYSKLHIFTMELQEFKGEKEPRLETAQEVLERAETWMKNRFNRDSEGRLLVVVDSLAAMEVEEEAAAGLTNQNMRTNMSLPSFLSKFSKRWMGRAAVYNAMIIMINQIRTSPKAYGNPEYAPGGNAKNHAFSVRATVRRVKGGRIMQGPIIVGLRGVIKNIKNKTGGGSLEGAEVGFETRFGKKKWRFPSASAVRKESSEE